MNLVFLLDIALFAGGIYTLVSGQFPTILAGGVKWQFGGTYARLVGALILIPLATYFINPYPELDLIIFLVVTIIMEITVYSLRQPRVALAAPGVVGSGISIDPVEEQIAKDLQGAVTMLALSLFAFFLFAPLAFSRANKIIKTIETSGHGLQYRSQAQIVRALSVAAIIIGLIGVCTLITSST